MKKLIIILSVFFFVAFLLASFSHAEDYVITYYKQGVVSIEHNDVIHVMGKRLYKLQDNNDLYGRVEKTRGIMWADLTETEKAERYEASGSFYKAASIYQKIGTEEKMCEIAHKDIEKQLNKEPPEYYGSAFIAYHFLKDKELSLFYYEKYIDQQLDE